LKKDEPKERRKLEGGGGPSVFVGEKDKGKERGENLGIQAIWNLFKFSPVGFKAT